MKIEECFSIGTVARPHGLKGEVTILLETSFDFDSEFPDTIFLHENNQLVPYFVSYSSAKGNKVYVKLEEIDTYEQAQLLSKSRIYLPKSARAPRGRKDFYDDEISGYEVTDKEFGRLGEIREVVRTGEQRLLSVTGKKEILIPVDAPFIQRIDRRNQVIHVILPEGYLDI